VVEAAAVVEENAVPKEKFSWPWQKREPMSEEQAPLPAAEPSTSTEEIAAVVENASPPQ
jgi:hypothetical protein